MLSNNPVLVWLLKSKACAEHGCGFFNENLKLLMCAIIFNKKLNHAYNVIKLFSLKTIFEVPTYFKNFERF